MIIRIGYEEFSLPEKKALELFNLLSTSRVQDCYTDEGNVYYFANDDNRDLSVKLYTKKIYLSVEEARAVKVDD